MLRFRTQGHGGAVCFDETGSTLHAFMQAYPGEEVTECFVLGSGESSSVTGDCLELLGHDWDSNERQIALAKACCDECHLTGNAGPARTGLLALELGRTDERRKAIADALRSYAGSDSASELSTFEQELASAVASGRLCRKLTRDQFHERLRSSLKGSPWWSKEGKTLIESAMDRWEEAR